MAKDVKDHRYSTVLDVVLGGRMETFDQIFTIVPKSVVYKDLGMNYTKFENCLKNPDLFTIRDLKAIAKLIGCDSKIIVDLAYDKSTKPKKK